MTDILQAPDATADRAVLLAWYRDVVQTYAACHNYEDFNVLCRWCLTDDQQVRARGAARYAGNKYCTDRCADAADAYRTKVLCGSRTLAPSAEDTAEDVA